VKLTHRQSYQGREGKAVDLGARLVNLRFSIAFRQLLPLDSVVCLRPWQTFPHTCCGSMRWLLTVPGLL